jgi:hypothetical protein
LRVRAFELGGVGVSRIMSIMESWHPVSKFLFLHPSPRSARPVEGSISDFDPGDREVHCAPGTDIPRGYLAKGVVGCKPLYGQRSLTAARARRKLDRGRPVPDQAGSGEQARKGWLQVGFEPLSASDAKKYPQAALEACWMTPTANLLS